MRIHVFKVESDYLPLEAAIDQAAILDKIERNLTVAKKLVRLESLKKENKLFFMDIAKIKNFGGSNILELTAALYDQQSQHIFVQYNHFGVRANEIASYFSQFGTGTYQFIPASGKRVMNHLLSKMKYTSKIELKIAASKIPKHYPYKGLAILEALEYEQKTGSDVMSLTLNRNRDRDNWLGPAPALVKMLIGEYPISEDCEHLLVVRVTGKESLDAATVTLDLLNHSIVYEFKITKWYLVDNRWEALRRFFNAWNEQWRR